MKKAVWTIIIAMLLWLIFFYKSLFFWEHKKLQAQLHITPYTREYFQDNKTNNLYINLKDINKYNQYCQTKHKNCQIFPHQSRIADSIRLKSVQHAGQISLDKTHLFEQLDTITSLQAYRTYPYIFAQLFLPNKKESNSSQKAINLWEKWTNYLCYQSGCYNYQLPQALAFNYYYYLQDIEKSVNYYEIAATSPWAPTSLLKMPAIVMWRWGYHSKSAIMRYQKTINEKDITLQQEYFDKAVSEYTLNIIQKAQKIASNTCKKDLNCLQKNKYISKVIQTETQSCQENPKIRKDKINCKILNYAETNHFIQKNGTLIYPLDPNMTYRRRSDIQDRRIILKTDI